MLRIAVVGCGKIAEKHLNAYRKIQDVDVVVTDVVEKGQAVARHYGAAWHPVPEELIHGGDVDAVDVCTPTPTHASFILDALAHGKHVFCEKPLARNLEEAAVIEDRAKEAGKVLMVGYLYRFHPAFQLVKEVIEEGIVGEPYYASFRLGGRGSHKAWKHLAATGGGAANEMLVHMVDLAVWFFGAPARVRNVRTATLLAQRDIEGALVDADAEDLVILELETNDGVHSLCQSDLFTPGYMNHVEVQGTNGSIFTSILDYLPTRIYCTEARGVYDRGPNFHEFPRVDLFERELAHFVETINAGSGRPLVNSVHDSIELMRVIEAALPAGAHDERSVGQALRIDPEPAADAVRKLRR